MRELVKVRNKLLGFATSTRSLQKVLRCTVDELGRVESIGWVRVKIERPNAGFAITHTSGEGTGTKVLTLSLRNGGVTLGSLEVGVEQKRRGMLTVLRDIARILAITLENRMLRGEGMGWLFEQVSHEVGRVDRYGGEFSVCLFCGVGGKRGAMNVSEKLKTHIRQVDRMDAWQGKVAVVMPSTGETGAVSAVRRLAELLREDNLRARVGVSTYPKDATFTAGLIEAAEIAADWASRMKTTVFTYGDLVRQTL